MTKQGTGFYLDCVEWDVATWLRAIVSWEKHAERNGPFMGKTGLEIGAHHGGASLFFARKFGAKLICTDIEAPSNASRSLHQRYGVAQQIEYGQIDARAIPYPDNYFDFVVFKSILGIIGSDGRVDDITQAMREIHRVLKPNGTLFFAENLCGSWLHQFARKKFVPWGNRWHYLSLQEMQRLLQNFSNQEVHTTGFIAAFVPKPAWLKNVAARVDSLLFFVPKHWQYVVYGFAEK